MIFNNTLETLCHQASNNHQENVSTRSKMGSQDSRPKIYSAYRSKKPSNELPTEPISTQTPKNSKWTQHRVDQICRKFVRKLKQGVVLQTVYTVDSDQNKFNLCFSIFGKTEGIDPHHGWVIVVDMLCLIMRLFLGILFSLDIVFDLGTSQIYFVSEIIGLIFFIIQISVCFVTKIDKQGRRIHYVKDIAKEYLKGTFATDIIYFGLILTDLVTPSSKFISFIRLIASIYKLIYSLQRVNKIEKISFSNHQAEQIWGMVLVLIVNFIFAHTLSLVLNALATANPQQNWWYMKGCQDDEWFVKYIYGAYWGTNIMLTVGFGDIAATNWMEALCLIFIEMISCVVLSYNISCLGSLITNLRKNNQDKHNNVRLFNRMYNEQTSSRQKKPTAMKDKVYQFLDNHYETKKQFDLEDEKQVISTFPDPLKETYFKQIYIPIIKYLPILRKLSTECLEKLVTKIQKIFVYPDSFVVTAGEKNKIIMLSKGELSFVFPRKLRKGVKNQIIEKVDVDNFARLISGKEVVFNQPSKYNIISTQFSIVHVIPGQDFRQIVKTFSRDHQNMCKMRDQQTFNDLVLGCLQCKICKQITHTKYDCPMLHYSPLKSIIITKSQSFTYKQNRVFVMRVKSSEWNLMRKSQLCDLPKTQKTFPSSTIIKKQSRARRHTIYEKQDFQISDFDRVQNWNVYFPKDNMEFRKDEDLDSDSD